MLLPAAVLTAIGFFLVGYSLSRQRLEVQAGPDAIDVALGNVAIDHEESQRPTGGIFYRVSEPLLDASAGLLRRVSPKRRLDLTRERIVFAGLEGSLTLEKMLSYKAVAALAAAAFGLLTGGLGGIPRVLWAVILGGLASFVPDVILSSRATERQNKIGQALPESLDLLALTVEAGLGFEQALEVVVDNGTGPLTGEFARLLREIEIGVPRREALGRLRERTDIPELASLVVALVQSDQMGIALSDVLKTQAAQVRLKRRQRAKEQAAKTPVKILFPVVLGVFPALFVVTIGPGAIQIAKALL